MDTFNGASEVDDGTSAIVSGGLEEGVEGAMEGPALLDDQVVMAKDEEDAMEDGAQVMLEEPKPGVMKEDPVVMEGNQVVMEGSQVVMEGTQVMEGGQVVMEGTQVVMEGTQVMMEGGQVVMEEPQEVMEGTQVVMDGTQVMMEGGQVVMEGTPVVMEGSEVVMEESPVVMEDGSSGVGFGPGVLQEDGHCPSPDTSGPVLVKQEDLEDSQYGHNQQILGLVGGGEEVVEDEGTGQGDMLLQDLVSRALESPGAQQQGHDNIVTTSSISHAPAPTLLRGAPQQAGPTRIVVQTNQGSPAKANQGHFLIQVGGTSVPVVPVQASSTPAPAPSKNHIVIRAGYNQTPASAPSLMSKEEPSSPGQQGSIFKVIIPEGTTKYTKTTPAPPTPPATIGQHEPVRKHVQINLTDSSSKRPVRYTSHTSQTPTGLHHTKSDPPAGDPKRFYECPTCNSKFMRPLYLRKHMRSCKKEEVKVEKAPLYMCSFCKMTFKTRPQISQHFLKCFHSPYRKKTPAVKRKGDGEEDMATPPKRGRMDSLEIDPLLEQAVQFRCQDCDRTFSKERQYTSHIKRCTKVSVHDLTGARLEVKGEEEEEEEPESQEDPFADPDPIPAPPRRGRGPGRRGRPPGRGNTSNAVSRSSTKASTQLFDGEYPVGSSRGLLVADNEGLVRSTTGLAHTVQLSLETASQEGQPQPSALVADSKGVRGRERPPQAWSLVCALCQKMFITKAALAHHVMAEHGADLLHARSILDGKIKNSRPIFRCPMCSLNYQSEEQFVEHMVLQHTARLQETFTKLQGQTATFVCSLCSLVLLTKNLLVEHLSLVHLDELETQAHGDTHVEIASRVPGRPRVHTAPQLRDRTTLADSKEVAKGDSQEEGMKTEQSDDSFLECGFCGEEVMTQEDMVEHYIECHGVETDEDGCLLDLGIDVDVRVKDTKGLLQLADGRVDQTVPEKTVLLRKKPRQSWQCKECQQVFSKHFDFLRHMREVCTEVSQASKPTVSRGGNFKCQEPGCSHLSFYQVKLLFKHMEEVHKIIVPKEFKTFRNLDLFYQWLAGEEKKYNVRYIRDTTRIEKNDMKLIQMVCHRFHTAKIDQSKEKKEGEVEADSPSKKRRWFVRIQRSSNCHARIHLKVQYNPLTQDYDGETQMVYYPQHTHAEVDHPQDLMNRIMERHSRTTYLSRNGNRKRPRDPPTTRGAQAKGDAGEDQEEDDDEVPSQQGSQEEGAALTVDQYMKEFCQTQLEEEEEVDGSALVSPAGSTHTVLQTGRQPQQQQQEVLLGEEAVFGEGGGQAVLVEGGEPGTYVVQEAEEEARDEATEEYVLPADEDEWTKLFDVLRLRLMTAELSQQEKGDGEGLLSYQNVISYLPLAEQVTIFQQLCVLTNTAIATAD